MVELGSPYRLAIYNRATGHTSEVVGDNIPLVYPALYGDTLFWSDGPLQYLAAGHRRGGIVMDNARHPVVYGNTLLWWAGGTSGAPACRLNW